jgi:anti-sigma B factor antagonist
MSVRSPADDFSVTSAQLGGETHVVSVTGELDVATSPALREALLAANTRPGSEVVVNLLSVPFIDSSALGVLVDMSKRLRARGGTLAVVCEDRQLVKIFEITGLTRILAVYPTLRDALEALGAEGSLAAPSPVR